MAEELGKVALFAIHGGSAAGAVSAGGPISDSVCIFPFPLAPVSFSPLFDFLEGFLLGVAFLLGADFHGELGSESTGHGYCSHPSSSQPDA